MKKLFLYLLCLLWTAKLSAQENAVLPTQEQVAWADVEVGVIIHLDINIYAPETFDYARRETLPDVKVFNPAKLNTDQWIRTAKAAGARYAVLTVKHGTGFCLWPSKVNSYNVGHTPWGNGRRDILKEFLASCRKYDLKPGLYYNTNSNTFYDAGRKPFASDVAHFTYNKAVLAQLNELWTNYGKMFEIWFDGGVNGDTKFGIKNEVLRMIRAKQPHAILFQGPPEAGNLVRWIGNEDGIAAYPQWSRTSVLTASDGMDKIAGLHGRPDGKVWSPGESDFPIRRNSAWNGGWLWKAGEEKDLFSMQELLDKYEKSVGRNTNMLVGVVIDTSGLIPKADSLVFDSLGKAICQRYCKPVMKLTNIRTKIIAIDLVKPKSVNTLVIQEDISKGEQIRKYKLEAFTGNRWKVIATGESIGHKRIQHFPLTTSSKLRFSITEAEGQVSLKTLAVYNM